LSKVGHENQSETIAHILVQKAKNQFEKGQFKQAAEDLDDAFRFSPSVSAKILRLKLHLVQGQMEDAKLLLTELVQEHPMFSSFLFVSLEDIPKEMKEKADYQKRLEELKKSFLDIQDGDLMNAPSI